MITLDHAQLSGLFPGYIELDCQMKMLRLGPSIAKRMPEFEQGTLVSDLFAFEGCVDSKAASDVIADLKPLKLTCRATGFKLHGQALKCASGYLLALQVAAEQLLCDSSDLEMSDFTFNDPAIHGLLLHGLQKALLEEQRSVSIELATEQRESANLLKRISRVSGYVAHEYNNLISSIRLHCDVLESELGKFETRSKLFKMIKNISTRSQSITRSLMNLSGGRGGDDSWICVDDLIENNLQLIKTIVGDNIHVCVDLNSSEGHIFGNEVSFLNALVDIFINTRDIIVNCGHIRIHTKLEHINESSKDGFKIDKYALVFIEIIDKNYISSDNSISSCTRTSYFASNSRLLDLPSVIELARNVGGEATFTSNAGQGGVVRLLLPASAHAASARDGRPIQMAGHRFEPIGARLLLVDDELYALEALQELLKAQGYQVTACKSAAEALDALAGQAFDALLSDIIMPGMSGTVLARRALGFDPNLAVILMSGYVPEGEGFGDTWQFVRKPIIVTQLMAALENGLVIRAANQTISSVSDVE